MPPVHQPRAGVKMKIIEGPEVLVSGAAGHAVIHGIDGRTGHMVIKIRVGRTPLRTDAAAQLEPREGGWIALFQHGRKGGAEDGAIDSGRRRNQESLDLAPNTRRFLILFQYDIRDPE